MSKNYIDLPNKVPVKNEGNLTAEQARYEALYKKVNRTTTGQLSFTSSTSGAVYSTTKYPEDPDVYNMGEDGLMNLLYKYVLYDSIISADDIKEIKKSVSDLRTEMYTKSDIGFENSVALMIEIDLALKDAAGYGIYTNRNYYLDCLKTADNVTIVKGTYSDGAIIV